MSDKQDFDVVVIGAGIAGLAAACELGGAGLSICVLEARDPILDREIPLRAEFIHGTPETVWGPLPRFASAFNANLIRRGSSGSRSRESANRRTGMTHGHDNLSDLIETAEEGPGRALVLHRYGHSANKAKLVFSSNLSDALHQALASVVSAGPSAPR